MAGIKIKVIDNTQVYIRAKDSATQEILNDIGQAAVEHARDLVPIDTGALHDSIDYDIDRTAVRIHADMEYASFVELGTRYQHAQPFLRPAVNDNLDEYRSMAESIYRGGASGKIFRLIRNIFRR